MKVGTKSLLFGIHQFLLHPFILFLAWKRLYGFPWHPALWLCFLVHDWGYWGMSDMDSPEEGQKHPELGAIIVGSIFGDKWYKFCLYHSRFYARANDSSPSQLCTADKLAFCYYPPRLYVFLAKLTGELELYKQFSIDAEGFPPTLTDLEWFHFLSRYTLRVVVQTNKTYRNYIR